KGSGRTVGAEAIAAVGAAIETLLNRCLDGAITPSRALITVVDDAIQALPGLIDAYLGGDATLDPASAALIERAERVASGRAVSEVDVRAVFCSDARARLDGVRQWLATRDRSAPTFAIDDSLSRGFHTLRGSAAVVNAVALSRLAGMIEGTLDTLRRANSGLPAAGLPLLDELVRQLAWWVEAVADEEPIPDEAADRYAARLAELHELPTPLADPPTEPAAVLAVIAAAPEVDAELQEIFLGEAQELLDALAVSSGLWGGMADDARSLGSLRRSLHTLKGSARMAAAAAIGAVAHRLETLLDRPADHAAATLVAAFDSGLDALQRQLDALKQGQRLPAEPVLAAIDAALGCSPAPAIVEVPAVLAEPAPEAPPPAVEPAPTAATAIDGWLPGLFPTPDDAGADAPLNRRETARVPVERLDAMLNQAGEIAIARARLDEHHAALKVQLGETTQTIARIRDQLRQMDIETDARISSRAAAHAEAEDRYGNEFDALEMDRYSRMQELSRALAESVGDLGSLHGSMEEALNNAEALLVQQGRQTTELQQGLMGTLMVPFSRQEQRLSRVVRQTAAENGRDAEPVYIGADAELDRNLLERMTAPLEHLLRNAVVHGIEPPDARLAAGKPARGSIEIKLAHEGSQLLVEVGDDGRGLDYAAIRSKAIERGLMSGRVELAPEALARFIFEPGFSTASRLTQDAGRGIGMDVVANQVRQLGGTLELRSEPGRGARFIIRLPLALAVSQALLVGIGAETFAIPLAGIEGVGRLPRAQAEALLATNGGRFRYGDEDWPLRHLADFLDLPRNAASDSRTANALLLRLGAGQTADGSGLLALVVDRLIGSREIVSKGAGPQLGSVPGIGGATILADGRVAMILDLPALIAARERRALLAHPLQHDDTRAGDARATVMVVDDSITMRRVAERLLLRHGYRVLTARDGVDAMAQLHTETPDAVLLDIEMPRADGFEVAAFIRQHAQLKRLPIVMVTSRSGEKHRARARQLGVDGYLTKPWQDEQLLATLRTLPGIRQ
uniref:hybrid sensor histidine kinase/response regulator n=1 Tax=Nevskia sp. TaxID=1929292 RepID=UPI0025DEE5EB